MIAFIILGRWHLLTKEVTDRHQVVTNSCISTMGVGFFYFAMEGVWDEAISELAEGPLIC